MTHCTHHPPQRCDGLMSEKEELLVQCMAQQGRIKVLEEERNGLLEERSNFGSQLQKASEGHKIMAEQLKLHESDFEKERAQREKLLAENDTLKSEKNSLQQEKNAVRAHVLYMYLTFSARAGVQCKMKCVRLLWENSSGMNFKNTTYSVCECLYPELVKLFESFCIVMQVAFMYVYSRHIYLKWIYSSDVFRPLYT